MIWAQSPCQVIRVAIVGDSSEAVVPGAVAIMALSFLYVLLGNAGPVEAILFGVKAAVLAIVVDAVVQGVVGVRQRAVGVDGRARGRVGVGRVVGGGVGRGLAGAPG